MVCKPYHFYHTYRRWIAIVFSQGALGSVNISEEETKRVKSDSVRFDKEHTLSICIITLKRKIGNIFLGY